MKEGRGCWECFRCGGDVWWQADFDYEDFGLEGEGIVSTYECSDCGSQYEVYTDCGDSVES